MSLVHSFQAHSSWIWQIKPSPFNNDYVATCSWDYTVKIWNTFDWTLIQTSYNVTEFEWLDKYTLASTEFYNGTILIRSITTGKTKIKINSYGRVTSLKLLNNKIHLAVGVLGDIYIHNINNANLVSSLKGHSLQANHLVQLSDEFLASTGESDRTIRIWNLKTNTCKFILTGHTNWVTGLKQITSSILASGSWDETIKLWDIKSGQSRTLTGHASVIYASVDLINSQTLVSGSVVGEVKLWNWSTGECLSTIQTNLEIVSLAVLNSVEGKRDNQFYIYFY